MNKDPVYKKLIKMLSKRNVDTVASTDFMVDGIDLLAEFMGSQSIVQQCDGLPCNPPVHPVNQSPAQGCAAFKVGKYFSLAGWQARHYRGRINIIHRGGHLIYTYINLNDFIFCLYKKYILKNNACCNV